MSNTPNLFAQLEESREKMIIDWVVKESRWQMEKYRTLHVSTDTILNAEMVGRFILHCVEAATFKEESAWELEQRIYRALQEMMFSEENRKFYRNILLYRIWKIVIPDNLKKEVK